VWQSRNDNEKCGQTVYMVMDTYAYHNTHVNEFLRRRPLRRTLGWASMPFPLLPNAEYGCSLITASTAGHIKITILLEWYQTVTKIWQSQGIYHIVVNNHGVSAG
jgi:hypothetical protein